MPETYTHLTEDERYQIYEGLLQGLSHRAIAKQLNRSHGTTSKEVIRNKGLRGYRPRQAQMLAQQRQDTKPKHTKLTPAVKQLITQNIKNDWSPEQVQGRLRSEGLPIVCFATIYDFIKRDKVSGGKLYKHLRHRKPDKKRTGKTETRG